jgi:hypothetical protein
MLNDIVLINKNTLLCMNRSECDNEKPLIPEFGRNQSRAETTFGSTRPTGLRTQHLGELGSLMAASNDAQGIYKAKSLSEGLKEPAGDSSEWSSSERAALALGLYIFNANADVISSIVGSKTVSAAQN